MFCESHNLFFASLERGPPLGGECSLQVVDQKAVQPLQHILDGLRLHTEWPNVSTFSDLHTDYGMLFGIGLRS